VNDGGLRKNAKAAGYQAGAFCMVLLNGLNDARETAAILPMIGSIQALAMS